MSIFKKILYYVTAERVGPDLPLTHPLLHSRRLGRWLCQRKFAHFGEGSEFRPGAFANATKNISIGKYVTIRPLSIVFACPTEKPEISITIDDYALIGSGVHIYVANHRYSDPTQPIYFQAHEGIRPVHLKTGCWIGANAVILPGVTIGRNAVVGAGSVVTKDVPDYALAAGQPARVIKIIATQEGPNLGTCENIADAPLVARIPEEAPSLVQ